MHEGLSSLKKQGEGWSTSLPQCPCSWEGFSKGSSGREWGAQRDSGAQDMK